MNVTRASSRGRPWDNRYQLLSIGVVPFLIISFAGTVFKLYSGAVWIIMVILYIGYTFHRGLNY